MENENLTGVFDSGIGGLSILKELLPMGGNYIYFGDTANLPYGNKTKEEIINFGRNTMNFFLSKGAKKVIMACNTSSALAYEALNKEFQDKIKIYPLIQTVAPYIANTAHTIGILATEGTIKSGIYGLEIKRVNKNAKVYELACPNFVEIVENSLYNLPESIEYIKKHVDFLLQKGCEKIVLGCTHYPYLMPILERFAPKDIFINPAKFMIKCVKMANTPAKVDFYVSDNPQKFKQNAKLFMEIKGDVTLIKNCPAAII